MNLNELQAQALTTSLYVWEDDLASRIGIGRTMQNKTKANRRSYNADSLMSDNGLANIHAVVCEIGVCRLMGAYCYAGVWDVADHALFSELPDGLWNTTELEIKWRRTGIKMPVDRKDAERNRLVVWAESKLSKLQNCTCETCAQGCGDTSRVRLLGGGMAQELWLLGKPYNNDENRIGVPLHLLKPIKEIKIV